MAVEHAIIDLLIMFRGRKATVAKFLRDEADKVAAGEYDDEVEATKARIARRPGKSGTTAARRCSLTERAIKRHQGRAPVSIRLLLRSGCGMRINRTRTTNGAPIKLVSLTLGPSDLKISRFMRTPGESSGLYLKTK
jgi:hypothetical protein